MKRGFPRPQMHVERTVTHRTPKSKGGYSYGSYGESWDNKTYPIPYTAEEDSISTLHSGRLEECIYNDCCLACGDPVGEDVHILYRDGLVHSEAGPFHEKCARLTQRMCPHIAVDGDKWQFKQEKWSEVKTDVVAAAEIGPW